jgi:pyruvate dehydrogenase E1 component alpha subunit
MEAALNHEDPMITAYRCHGHAYMRGITPHEVFAEMMAKRTGNA